MATSLLLDLGFDEAEAPTPGMVTRIVTPQGAKHLTVEYVKHEEIHPDPGQPRKHADAALWRSVALSGILQPLTVRPCPEAPFIPELGADADDEARRRRVRAIAQCSHCARPWTEIAAAGEFMIVDGERRWRAAGSGVQGTIPVMVRVDQEERGRRLLTQAAANTGKPLTPIEEAELYAEALADDPSLTHAIVADIVGKSRSSVTDRLALLKNAAWVPLLRTGEITVSQALELSRHAEAYPEVHEAAIEYMRRGAELDDVEKIAEIELVEFRQMVALAYADHTESAPLPTVAPRVEREQREEAERAPAPAPREESTAAREPAPDVVAQESEAEDGRKGREPLREPVASPSGSASPVASVPGGLFAHVPALLGGRSFMLNVAAGAAEGTLRVTLLGQKAAPVIVSGTPAELDAALPAAIASFIPGVGGVLAGAVANAKKQAAKPAAKKTTAKKSAKKKGGAK